MKDIVILVLIIFSISFITGCKTMEPWEKEMLGSPIMRFAAEQELSTYEQHMLNAREGSSGGYGGAGGGCGCK